MTEQAARLNNWKIAGFIGTVIFLLSGFMPMISHGSAPSVSLLNLYAAVGQGTGSSVSLTIDVATIGMLLTLILYPVTVILGFVSIMNRKVAAFAGILGLICWIGTLMYLAQFDAFSYAGSGIYVGIVGAIIIALAYVLRPSPTLIQVAEETAAPTRSSSSD